VSTDSYKVFEALTDSEGKVKIEGMMDLFVNEPEVSVYRKGYVLWNNRYIFPGWKERTDFNWTNNYVFRLEKFKSEYKYLDHLLFIHNSTHAGLAAEKKQLMDSAYRWEGLKSVEETRKWKK
jgi:hypothetical protein